MSNGQKGICKDWARVWEPLFADGKKWTTTVEKKQVPTDVFFFVQKADDQRENSNFPA